MFMSCQFKYTPPNTEAQLRACKAAGCECQFRTHEEICPIRYARTDPEPPVQKEVSFRVVDSKSDDPIGPDGDIAG